MSVLKGDMLIWSRVGGKPWHGICTFSDGDQIKVRWMRKGNKTHLEDYSVKYMEQRLEEKYFTHYPRRRK